MEGIFVSNLAIYYDDNFNKMTAKENIDECFYRELYRYTLNTNWESKIIETRKIATRRIRNILNDCLMAFLQTRNCKIK